MSSVIETHRLTKLYDTGKGCKNITLSVSEGQIFGFLGPNGAGKSTFVKTLIGLLQPTSGEAHLMGLPLGSLEAHRQIGYLPELFRYQDWLTGEEVLRFHAKLGKLPNHKRDKRIEQVLSEVGLINREKHRVKHYSKGMQQRLGLACALLLDPKVLFLDEPSSALDPGGRYEVRQLLVRLREQGKTVFLNTHLLEDVEAICDEVALLHNGEIKASGTVDQLTRTSAVWRFRVGGFMPDSLKELYELTELPIHLQSAKPDGSAVLEVEIADEEQVGYLNYQLVQNGFTLYEAERLKNRLEEWFLELTESKKGGYSAE